MRRQPASPRAKGSPREPPRPPPAAPPPAAAPVAAPAEATAPAPAPTAPPPAPAPSGEAAALSPEGIQEALRAGGPAISACLARAGEADLDGRTVAVRIIVTASGAVRTAALDDAALASTELGRCLVEAARRLAFPGFSGGPRRVEVPVTLAR